MSKPGRIAGNICVHTHRLLIARVRYERKVPPISAFASTATEESRMLMFAIARATTNIRGGGR